MPVRDIAALTDRARWLRLQIWDMVMRQESGHVPSSFSMVEILTALYYGGIVRFQKGEPRWPERDRVIVSKGHAAAALYPILADLEYFAAAELERFTQPGGLLGMYADSKVPGIEGISGSLGHGLGMAAGFCFAAKQDGAAHRSFVILGDGECYEGSVWETAAFASHHRLDNLVAIVDRNQLCILGKTEDLVRIEPLADKWTAFGWETVRVDGHDFAQLFQALDRVGRTNGKPLCIVADTIKGKGVSFMEGKAGWHNKIPSAAEQARAREEIARP